MTPRQYHPIWRILAGLVSLCGIVIAVRILRGDTASPDWAAVAGLLLVLLWLPFVAITGRAPAWAERMLRRDL